MVKVLDFFLWKMILIPFLTYAMITGTSLLSPDKALRSGTRPFLKKSPLNPIGPRLTWQTFNFANSHKLFGILWNFDISIKSWNLMMIKKNNVWWIKSCKLKFDHFRWLTPGNLVKIGTGTMFYPTLAYK